MFQLAPEEVPVYFWLHHIVLNHLHIEDDLIYTRCLLLALLSIISSSYLSGLIAKQDQANLVL